MTEDRIITELVREGTEYYDEEISGSDSWALFYNLSSLRRAALLWYPVSREDNVLEVGCGHGAVTGALCDRAGRVDVVEIDPQRAECTRLRYRARKNLSVITGDVMSCLPDRRYSLIVVMELLEWYKKDVPELLELLKKHLVSGGRLLIGFRNRFGIKYACGMTDEVVCAPGGALQPESGLWTADELTEALKGAGLSSFRRYYPYPDFAFTQAVFSDEYLPKGCISDRIITYDPFGEGSADKARAEHCQLDALAESGMLAQASNCVFIECAASSGALMSHERHVTGAYISADREEPNAFCTRLFSDGSVEKEPVHKSGEETIRSAAGNAAALSARGISTVLHEVRQNGGRTVLMMPLIKDTPLLDHIRSLLRTDTEAVKELFFRLREDILRSSEPCSEPDPLFSGADGPYLETGYIDMIPLNAFFRDGSIVYYDQEFTMKGCPVKYIMYRAIRYTWLTIKDAENYLPLEEMKALFGLTELWDSFTRTEDEFTGRNRRRSRYAQLYRWAWGAKPYGTGLVMGTFDLFHMGHLNLIRRAKDRCERLIVGVMSDELVFKYKNKYPVIPLEERMAILRAVRYVDEVFPVRGEYVSKVEEWHRRHYDCFFSGDDYADNDYWKKEKAELAALGCAMEFFPYTKEVSSTMIRGKLDGDGNGKR